MRGKFFYIWVFLLGLVILVYYFSIRFNKEEEGEYINKDIKRLIQLTESTEVKYLELVTNNNISAPIHIERQSEGNSWLITSPICYKADDIVINRFLNLLIKAKCKEVLSCKIESLADFGLKTPQLIYTIVDYQGSRRILQVGELSPSKEFLYFAVISNYDNDDKIEIFLLPSSLYGKLPRSLFDLRCKKVLNFKKEEVKEVISKGFNNFSLIYIREGYKPYWELIGYGEANFDIIDRLLDQLQGLQALNFQDLDINLKNVNLNCLNNVIILIMQDGSKLGLVFGDVLREDRGRYVRRLVGNSVMIVSNDDLKKIEYKPQDLIQRRVIHLNREEINSLTIQHEGKVVNYKRIDSVWKKNYSSKNGESTDLDLLFLWDLIDLKWDRVIVNNGENLDNPDIVITLGVNSLVDKNKLYAPINLDIKIDRDKNNIIARISSDCRIFIISEDFIKKIPYY